MFKATETTGGENRKERQALGKETHRGKTWKCSQGCCLNIWTEAGGYKEEEQQPNQLLAGALRAARGV